MDFPLVIDIDPWTKRKVITAVKRMMEKGTTNPELISDILGDNLYGTYSKDEVLEFMRLAKEDRPIPYESDGSKRRPLKSTPEPPPSTPEVVEGGGKRRRSGGRITLGGSGGGDSSPSPGSGKERGSSGLDDVTTYLSSDKASTPPLGSGGPSEKEVDEGSGEVVDEANWGSEGGSGTVDEEVVEKRVKSRNQAQNEDESSTTPFPTTPSTPLPPPLHSQSTTPSPPWPPDNIIAEVVRRHNGQITAYRSELKTTYPAVWNGKFMNHADVVAKRTMGKRRKTKTEVKGSGMDEEIIEPNELVPPSEPPMEPVDSDVAERIQQLVNDGDYEGLISYTEGLKGRGTEMSSPPPDQYGEPYETRWKKFNNMLSAMRRTNTPFDPAGLAESMGYHDIAERWRKGQISAQVMAPPMGGPMIYPVGQEGTGGGFDNMEQFFMSMLKMKMMAPLLKGIVGDENENRDVERRLEELVNKHRGDPQVEALKEQFRAFSEKDREKSLISPFQDQLRRLEEDLRTKNVQSPELVSLKQELSRLQDKMSSDKNQIEQWKVMSDMVKNSGGDLKDIYAQIEKMRSDSESKVEAMRMQERQNYINTLTKLEDRIESMRNQQSGQSGDPIQSYAAVSGLVHGEVDRIRKMTEGDKSLTQAVPEMLSGALQQLSPAITEFARAQAYKAGAPPMQHGIPAQQAVGGQQVQRGQCPSCGKTITVPLTGGACPECGAAVQAVPQQTGGPTSVQYVDDQGRPIQVRDPQSPVIA